MGQMQWKIHNLWIETKEETFQVVLDALDTHCLGSCIYILLPDGPYLPKSTGSRFEALTSEEDTISFLSDLGHAGVINSLNDAVVNQMHQPWRTFSCYL
ncbi:hypothetical protein Tco_1183250 [Tanacetum coccineum]